MKALLVYCSRLLFRLNLWLPGVTILSWMGRCDSESIVLFAYPLQMCGNDPKASRILAKLIRLNLDRSAEGNLWLASIARRIGRPKLALCIYKRTMRLSNVDNGVPAASVLFNLVESIVDRSIHKEIAEAVDSLHLQTCPDQPLVLVPISDYYFPLFELWWEQARKHVRGRFVILAMDPIVREKLLHGFDCSTLDFSQFFAFNDDGYLNRHCKGTLWILRVLVLRELIARRRTVVSLDLDAIVLDNLDDLLAQFPPSDILIQKDFSIPLDVARELGFIVCCGFMVLRPTDACLDFMNRYAQATIRELDDQTAINHMISRAKVTKLRSTQISMTFESDGLTWICPDNSLVSRDLNHGRFIRHFLQHQKSIAELRTSLGLDPHVDVSAGSRSSTITF